MPPRKSSTKKAAGAGRSPATLSDDHPIQAVVGSDTVRVPAEARELAAKLTPADGGDFALDTIDGAAETVDEAVQRIHETVDALNTLPFFGGKLVWLKNATCLADSVVGRSERVTEALDKLATTLQSGLPQGVKFLLSSTEVDKRKSFYKRLSSVAKMHVHDALDFSGRGGERELAAMLQSRARELGFQFHPDALDLFSMLCEHDARQIESELLKLSVYLGKGGIATTDDVRLMVAHTKAAIIWEVGNSFARRDLPATLHHLDLLLKQGENAIGILYATLAPTIRNLLHAKVFLEENHFRPPAYPNDFANLLHKATPASIERLPKKKDGSINTYPLGIAAVHSGKFTLNELRDALAAVARANLELVTTQIAPAVVLGKFVMKSLATNH